MISSPERKRTKQRVMEGIKRGKSMVRPEPCSLEQKGMPLDRNQPARSKWLQEGGPGEDNLYYLCCSICSTKVAACKLQSTPQNIKSHEASQLHQRVALKWQEIQDKRGVFQGYQDAAAQFTAQRRVVPDKQQASRRAQ